VTAIAAAVVCVPLLFWAGRRGLGGWVGGILTALAFAASPLLLNGAASPALRPLPFEVVWLLAIQRAAQSGAAAPAVAGAVALGAGLYVHPTAVVVFPLLLLIGLAVIPPRLAPMSLAAFGVVALPLAAYAMRHPELAQQRAVAHHWYDANTFGVLQGAREMSTWLGLTVRAESYWKYIDPATLYFSGGVLRGVLAPFVAVGLWNAATRRNPSLEAAAAGYFAVPAIGALAGMPFVPSRVALLLPFAALLAASGALQVASSMRRWIATVPLPSTIRRLPAGTSSGRALST
jgi:hypothetical protein